MKTVACLFLLLHVTMETIEQCRENENGTVRIIGTDTPDLVAGRLEICAEGRWRAVYHENWGNREAEIVCRERGFLDEDSCFGYSSLEQGYTRFDNCGRQPNLVVCGEVAPDGHFPHDNAGVICFRSQNMTTPCLGACCDETPFPTSCLATPTSCPNMSCPACPEMTTPTCDTPATQRQMDATTTNCSSNKDARASLVTPEIYITIITSLGALSIFLFLILVGVVAGWACSCQNRKRKSVKRSIVVVESEEPVANPNYSPGLSKYSDQGPQDMPTSHALIPMVPQGQDGRQMPYEVPVPGPSPRGEEEVGGYYEVPIEKKEAHHDVPTPNTDKKRYAVIPIKKKRASYNVLQHH